MPLLPGVIARNWTLKLVALFLAVMLWVTVRIEAPDRQLLRGVTVQAIVNDPEWALVGQPDPATVDIWISGPTRDLMAIAGQPPGARVVLDSISSQDTVVALSRDWLAFPAESGVVVDEMQPATIRLAFDRNETVSLPFDVPMVGSLDSTMALSGPPDIIPRRGSIRGPSRRIAELGRIPVLPVDLSQVGSSGRIVATVDTTALPEGLVADPTTLAIEISLEPSLTRTFIGIPVQIESPDDLVSDPASVDVTVHGAASLVERLSPFDIALVTRAPTAPPSEEGVDLAIVVRNAPDLISVTPTIAQVRVRPRSEGAPGAGGR